MSDTGIGRSRYATELEHRFMSDATEVPNTDGRAWLWHVPLVALVKELANDVEFETYAALEIFERANDISTETLVDLTVRNPGPPSWDWSLDSFRIGDRGFLIMLHEDPREDPMLPVFAAWEPFDSQGAFEAAFVAGYAENLEEFIGLATHFSLHGRMTPALWERALHDAVKQTDNWNWLAGVGDYTGTINDEAGQLAALQHYITTRGLRRLY